MEVDERFLFNLRNYTHEACVFGHWNPQALTKHYSGRQASRLLSSELTAGTKLFESGKQRLAELHWDRALKSLQNPHLFTTWYHETPIRLLFEIGRVSHLGHEKLASTLIQNIKTHAHAFLNEKDPRHALFTVFGELPVFQLKDLYERAALSLRKGLESRVEKHNPLLYEIRLNRALDLLWYDGKTDLTKWLPSVEEIEALGPDNPLSVYFLLLEAYRLTASESYFAADQVCLQIRSRLSSLKEIPGRVDPVKIGLAYRRLGRQQYEKGRHEDARLSFNTALMYIDKTKLSDLVEIYQYQELLANHADDKEDVNLWKGKLQQLENDTVQEEQNDLQRSALFFPQGMSDHSPIHSHGHIGNGYLKSGPPLISSSDAWSLPEVAATFIPNNMFLSTADADAAFLTLSKEPENFFFDEQTGMDDPLHGANGTQHASMGSIVPLSALESTASRSANQEWSLSDLNAARSPRSVTL